VNEDQILELRKQFDSLPFLVYHGELEGSLYNRFKSVTVAGLKTIEFEDSQEKVGSTIHSVIVTKRNLLGCLLYKLPRSCPYRKSGRKNSGAKGSHQSIS